MTGHDTHIQKCIDDIKEINLVLTDLKEWVRRQKIKEEIEYEYRLEND